MTALGRDTRQLALHIRRTCLQLTHRARSSHIGSALSISDIVAVLFGSVLKLDPVNPKWELRDRFILSKGHACAAVYAALAESGFYDKNELLQSFGTDHSNYMTHISHKVRGVEFSTGSLGHGLPFGVGKALAGKKKGNEWQVFVLLSDGELDEGSNWEAIMFASHHGLDNMVAVVDYNKLQSLTTVERTLRLEPLSAKFEAFGWRVVEVDGHNHDELLSAMSGSPGAGKPTVLIAHTTKGKGVSFMEGRVEWHYRSPRDDEFAAAMAELQE